MDVLLGNVESQHRHAAQLNTHANAFCERLIGSVRRECLDFLIALHDRHLRGILKEWVAHYNKGRPHSGLGPGIPEPTEGIPVLEISGQRIPCGHRVVGNSVLGGLHHEYRLEKSGMRSRRKTRERRGFCGAQVLLKREIKS
jgi:putative transposase